MSKHATSRVGTAVNAKKKKGGSAAGKKQVDLTSLHPDSRKVAQILRKQHRDIKIAKIKAHSNNVLTEKGMKVLWFQEHLDVNRSDVLSVHEICDMIELYLKRNDDELATLKNLNRRDALEQKIKDENQLFDVGIEVPDMMRKDNLKALQSWTGELRFLSTIKLKRFTRLRTNAV